MEDVYRESEEERKSYVIRNAAEKNFNANCTVSTVAGDAFQSQEQLNNLSQRRISPHVASLVKAMNNMESQETLKMSPAAARYKN